MALKSIDMSMFNWSSCRDAVSQQHGNDLPASTEVRLTLVEAIRVGLLKPGTRLKEAELGELLSVSRTPLREALTALKSEHIITAGKDGLRIRQLDWRDITDLYELRATLEGMAGRLAAEKSGHSEKAVLQELCNDEDMMICQGAAPEALAQHNAMFHSAILSTARNQFLSESLVRHSQMLVLLGVTAYSVPSRIISIQAEHHAVNAAIQSGDAEGCERAMKHHLHEALKARLKLASLSTNSEMD